ncbi:MAG: insulinase family protein [Bacteroidales bacterium]|nr:insulinase family protein [Bacteroidales bacterium]
MDKLNREQQPKLNLVGLGTMASPRSCRFENGIKVHLFEGKAHEAIRLDLVFKAGTAYQQVKLAASSTNRMLKEGTKQFTGRQIASKLDYYGAYTDLTATKDFAWISLFGLRKHFPKLLPIYESMVKAPAFKPADFKVLNRQQKHEFVVNSQKPKHLARRVFNQELFGAGSPYGQTADEIDYDRLKPADLADFYAGFYGAGNCEIIISGAIDRATEDMVHERFAGAWGIDTQAAAIAQPHASVTGLNWVSKPGALQSAIQMGKYLFNRKHPDFAGFLVLNTVLGGYFGSRLMANIREDKGYTYGIHSQLVPLEQGGFFVIGTETGRDVTQAALEEIRNELLRLIHEPIPEDELVLVKNYLTGSYLRGLDGVYNQADKFKAILGLGEGMEYYNKVIRTVQDISAEVLQELAVRYLQPDSMLTVVAGERV